MKITQRQLRQIIKEELQLEMSRDEGTGYEYLDDMPTTVDWTSGPVDEQWVAGMVRHFQERFPNHMSTLAAENFVAMLSGEPVDPDVVQRYTRPDGRSKYTRQRIGALVDALMDPANSPPPPPSRGPAGMGRSRFY
jgi:hypothetical protein